MIIYIYIYNVTTIILKILLRFKTIKIFIKVKLLIIRYNNFSYFFTGPVFRKMKKNYII